MVFDVSLSIELHQEQMDFTVMYFKNVQVMTKCLSSAFLGHTEDLKLKFEDATQNLDTKRMVRFQWMDPLENPEQYY